MAFFKKRTKDDVAGTESFSRSSKKNGKPRKSGTIVHFKDGSSTVLLTPSGKGEKYSSELKTGISTRNDGSIKKDEYGYPVDLTSEQRAFRSGYLQAQKDSSKAYKAKKNNRPK
ncbi:MAG: hypothetical protein ACI4MS_06400 [Candidatus Coproplasma sp.]